MSKWYVDGILLLHIRQKHTIGHTYVERNIGGVQTTVLTVQKYVIGGIEVPVLHYTTVRGLLKRWTIRYILLNARVNDKPIYEILADMVRVDPYTVDTMFGAGPLVGTEAACKKEIIEKIDRAIEDSKYLKVLGCAFVKPFSKKFAVSDMVGIWKELVEAYPTGLVRENLALFEEVKRKVELELDLPSYAANPIELMTCSKRPEHSEVFGLTSKQDYPEEVLKIARALYGKEEEVPRQILFYREVVQPMMYVGKIRAVEMLPTPLEAGLILLLPIAMRLATYLSSRHIVNFELAFVMKVEKITEKGDIEQGEVKGHIDCSAELTERDIKAQHLLDTSRRVKKLAVEGCAKEALEEVKRWLETAGPTLNDVAKRLTSIVRGLAEGKSR